MNESFRMSRWAALLGVVLAAIVAGAIGYQFGVSHAVAVGQVATVPPNVVPVYGWYRPWGFGFGFFFPFLFVALWFVILRGLLWGGPWRRRWSHGGPYDAPSRFEEWHRRAHNRMKNEPSSGVNP